MQIWSIFNITPDSFYAKSRYDAKTLIHIASNALRDGADVLDVGAESSRPFSEPVSAQEEWDRLEEPLYLLKKKLSTKEFSTQISIDTYKSEIAEKVLQMGVRIINDISAGSQENMFDLLAQYNAKVVLMHSLTTPDKMQIDPQYDDVVKEVFSFLEKRTELAMKAGIKEENIIWDFGIGFGKKVEHNLLLLKNIAQFKSAKFKLMAGVSRKSFLGKILNLEAPEDRNIATVIMHTYLALHNIDILRVHDTNEALQVKNLLSAIKGQL